MIAAAAWLLVAATGAVAGAQTFTNPIVGGGADPWAFQWKGQYFYTRTTASDVRVSRSP